MTARAISIEYYHEHLASGKRPRQWMRVLSVIDASPLVTRAALAHWMNLPISSITGRVKELLDAQLIEEVAGVECPVTHNRVHGLKRRQPDLQRGELFEEAA